MRTQPYRDARALAAAALLALALAVITAGCGDAAVPLGLDGIPSQSDMATIGIELNPQPEPPSLLRLPYHMAALGRGEFHGDLGSCELHATLTIVATTGMVTHIRWSFEAVAPLTGETLSGELFGILNRTTGLTISNGVLSSSLPAVQFRAHEDGRFVAGADGEPSQFTGLISLNPQPEPPSAPSAPPSPCLTELTRTGAVR